MGVVTAGSVPRRCRALTTAPRPRHRSAVRV